MLFHYHYWTPHLEETEDYYLSQGFKVHQRVGKVDGKFKLFNPPLNWDDFRKDQILFRIIEMRRGFVNITIGYGKSVRFDHIGFLVGENEYKKICQNAMKLEWTVNHGDRRTFLNTTYGFKIELQKHHDVVEMNYSSTINRLNMSIRKEGLVKDLSLLFDNDISTIETSVENLVRIKEVEITDIKIEEIRDPNGVLLLNI